jgi:uncharacterized membrane protein
MQAAMIVFRLFHVICAVLWVGGFAMLVSFVMPAIRASGPSGGQVMRNMLVKTRLASYFPIVGGLTVLSGLLMMWYDSKISQSNWGATATGMTFSIGGLAGLLALIVGGVMVGRSIGQLRKIALANDPGTPPSPEQAARMAQLQARAELGNRIVGPLLGIAMIAMAIARYV